jgi:hypothetical protein
MLFLPPFRPLDASNQALGPETFATFSGVLLTRTADLTAQNLTAATTVIPWDNEVFDTDNFHSLVTNTSRITIPSAVNGRYGIFSCNVWCTSLNTSNWFSAQVNKNGSAPNALASSGSFVGDTQCAANVVSLPFLLTTGDFYEVLPYTPSDTSVTIESDQSYFSLMVLP